MRKPCERCMHAVEAPCSGLHCARSGGGFRCEDERVLGWLATHAHRPGTAVAGATSAARTRA